MKLDARLALLLVEAVGSAVNKHAASHANGGRGMRGGPDVYAAKAEAISNEIVGAGGRALGARFNATRVPSDCRQLARGCKPTAWRLHWRRGSVDAFRLNRRGVGL